MAGDARRTGVTMDDVVRLARSKRRSKIMRSMMEAENGIVSMATDTSLADGEFLPQIPLSPNKLPATRQLAHAKASEQTDKARSQTSGSWALRICNRRCHA